MGVLVEKPVRLRQFAIALKPFVLGVALFILGFAANWLCRNLLGGRFMLLAAFALVVAAGSIALWYERLRMRDILEKLIVVREMNHHVRNALQVVTLAASAHHEDLAKMVLDAVARIEWALKSAARKRSRPTFFGPRNHRFTERP